MEEFSFPSYRDITYFYSGLGEEESSPNKWWPYTREGEILEKVVE